MTAANMGVRRRRYDAPKRRAGAADTRAHILQAALRLLAERGYLGTTVEAIAAQAGVGVRTVYDTFGSKQGVLRGVIESFSPMPRPDFEARAAASAADPVAQLRLIISFVVDYYTAAEQFLDVLEASAGADPGIAALRRTGERLRRDSQRQVLHNWLRRGALKPHLSVRRAGDILWALTSPHLYRLFVHDLGWSQRAYTQWLGTSVRQLLFADR